MPKKKDFFARVRYEPSATPVCEHFGECGGCRYQDMQYEKQLELKQKYLKKLFGKEILVHPSPQYGYRNRMDFVYRDGKLSLRKRGDFSTIIPISTCHLIPPQLQARFDQVQQLLDTYNIPSYDEESRVGLRYVVFRYAPATDELMLVVTSTHADEVTTEFVNELPAFAHSVYWYLNPEITDVSIPSKEPHLQLGNETITDSIAGVHLSYGPQSFFQSNSQLATTAIETMKEQVKGVTVDLCCGVGTIGLAVAQNTTQLIGVELVEEAIAYAKKNAEANGIQADFTVCEMKKLKDVVPTNIDTLIIDPPRAGTGKKTMKRIAELSPKRIIYLSCNPKTQAIDLKWLEELGGNYKVTFHEAFDFFPNTSHVESLMVLERIM